MHVLFHADVCYHLPVTPRAAPVFKATRRIGFRAIFASGLHMDTPDLPDHFGRYEVKSKLGEGGFAIVYRARDPMLGREVALKALLPALCADGDIRRRFLAEAHAIAPLHHPNIVTIFDVDEANDLRRSYHHGIGGGHSLAQIVATYGTLSYSRSRPFSEV
ncbi:MAG: hypothetical protein U0531_17065 [Dehalococcoidia bacterium]